MRRLLILAAMLPLLGAARPASVDYRLGAQSGAAAVELRFRGDADGETLLELPAAVADLSIKGAKVVEGGPARRILRHRPGARIVVRYRVGAAEGGVALPGEAAFAVPGDRAGAAATFAWSRRPPGWKTASDLEGRSLTVADVAASITLAGPTLAVRDGAAGLRVATFGETAGVAEAAGAQRAYWRAQGPELVAAIPGYVGATARGGGVAIPIPAGGEDEIGRAVGRGYARAVLAARMGRAAPDWLVEGFADVLADRVRLRAGQDGPEAVALRLDALLKAHDAAPPETRERPGAGVLLALKWDEDVRKATGGKADLDDVVLRMRDHAALFPPGQRPDVATGLVSAAWVIARLDLRPDIARHIGRGAIVELPEELFDGCLQARVTVSPGFDAGFDSAGSFAARVARGVRPRGPAWNAGLRNGMRLDAWTFQAGDMTRQIELTVRPANGRGRARKLAFWPYGDADVRTRRFQLTPGLSAAEIAACGRKMGGL